jgi:hypothetical protein
MAAETDFGWALVYSRLDVLYLLAEHPGAGFTTAEIALYSDMPIDITEGFLRGLALAHEAEQRDGRWHATTRGMTLIHPPAEWAEAPF